jgi:hypothetical protein
MEILSDNMMTEQYYHWHSALFEHKQEQEHQLCTQATATRQILEEDNTTINLIPMGRIKYK